MNPELRVLQNAFYGEDEGPPLLPLNEDVPCRKRKRSTAGASRPVPVPPKRRRYSAKECFEPLSASVLPEGFPAEASYRALAAYALLRTLSCELRLSPFSSIAFLRALYLPCPSRLLGQIHVSLFRILLVHLNLGYAYRPRGGHSQKKRKVDGIRWPLRAGDNLTYLDRFTWPLFYDDYCHLTADVLYSQIHDDTTDFLGDGRNLGELNLKQQQRYVPEDDSEDERIVPLPSQGPVNTQYFTDGKHVEPLNDDDSAGMGSDGSYHAKDGDDEEDDDDDDDDEYQARRSRKKQAFKAPKRKSPRKSQPRNVTPAALARTPPPSSSSTVPNTHMGGQQVHQPTSMISASALHNPLNAHHPGMGFMEPNLSPQAYTGGRPFLPYAASAMMQQRTAAALLQQSAILSAAFGPSTSLLSSLEREREQQRQYELIVAAAAAREGTIAPFPQTTTAYASQPTNPKRGRTRKQPSESTSSEANTRRGRKQYNLPMRTSKEPSFYRPDSFSRANRSRPRKRMEGVPGWRVKPLVASNEIVDEIQKFVSGQASQTRQAEEDKSSIHDDTSDDESSVLETHQDQWPHFQPLKAMRLGVPYHRLSISGKLTILEFLLDELLSVDAIASEFTRRQCVTGCYHFPYGPLPKDSELEDLENDDECQICRKEGELLCCDGCTASYHRACLDMPTGYQLPEGKWHCPECMVVDPSRFGPLRGGKKAELDWFSVADIQAVVPITEGDVDPMGTAAMAIEVGSEEPESKALEPTTESNDTKTAQENAQQTSPNATLDETQQNQMLVVQGFVFSRENETSDDPTIQDASKQSLIPVAKDRLDTMFKKFPPGVASAWPLAQIPYPPVPWAGGEQRKNPPAGVTSALASSESYDPMYYHSKYRMAPLPQLMKVGGASQHSSLLLSDYESHCSPCHTFRVSETLASDLVGDKQVAASLRSSVELFDPYAMIKDYLIRLAGALRRACLIDELWEIRTVRDKIDIWMKNVKKCKSIPRLAQLLLRLVDAAHPRAFLGIWHEPLEGKPDATAENNEGRTFLPLESDWTPEGELRKRRWERSSLSNIRLLLAADSNRNGVDVDARVVAGASRKKRKNANAKTVAMVSAAQKAPATFDEAKSTTHGVSPQAAILSAVGPVTPEGATRQIGSTAKNPGTAEGATHHDGGVAQGPGGVIVQRTIPGSGTFDKMSWQYTAASAAQGPARSDRVIPQVSGANTTKGLVTPADMTPQISAASSAQSTEGLEDVARQFVIASTTQAPGSSERAAPHVSSKMDLETADQATPDAAAVDSSVTSKNGNGHVISADQGPVPSESVPSQATDGSIEHQHVPMTKLSTQNSEKSDDEQSDSNPNLSQSENGDMPVTSEIHKQKDEAAGDSKKKRASRSCRRSHRLRTQHVLAEKIESFANISHGPGDASSLLVSEMEMQVEEQRKAKLTELEHIVDAPFLREGNWPVAGRKLFAPVGLLPTPVVKRLARNAGSIVAPFVTYSATREVGMVAFSHSWRKKTANCVSFEELLLQIRVLESYLDRSAINSSESLARRPPSVRAQVQKVIQCTQRDISTGIDFHFVVHKGRKRGCWVSSMSADLSTIIHYRCSRRDHWNKVVQEKEEAKIRLAMEARRLAAEKEAKRLAAEKEAKRLLAEKEAKKLAAEQEARKLVEAQRLAQRIAAEEEAKRLAAEREAQRQAERRKQELETTRNLQALAQARALGLQQQGHPPSVNRDIASTNAPMAFQSTLPMMAGSGLSHVSKASLPSAALASPNEMQGWDKPINLGNNPASAAAGRNLGTHQDSIIEASKWKKHTEIALVQHQFETQKIIINRRDNRSFQAELDGIRKRTVERLKEANRALKECGARISSPQEMLSQVKKAETAALEAVKNSRRGQSGQSANHSPFQSSRSPGPATGNPSSYFMNGLSQRQNRPQLDSNAARQGLSALSGHASFPQDSNWRSGTGTSGISQPNPAAFLQNPNLQVGSHGVGVRQQPFVGQNGQPMTTHGSISGPASADTWGVSNGFMKEQWAVSGNGTTRGVQQNLSFPGQAAQQRTELAQGGPFRTFPNFQQQGFASMHNGNGNTGSFNPGALGLQAQPRAYGQNVQGSAMVSNLLNGSTGPMGQAQGGYGANTQMDGNKSQLWANMQGLMNPSQANTHQNSLQQPAGFNPQGASSFSFEPRPIEEMNQGGQLRQPYTPAPSQPSSWFPE